MLFGRSGCDWMIVGLGNPGKEYEKTRHNVGFRSVELLAGQLKTKIDRIKFKALTRMVNHQGKKILLVEPQTYMNLSGAAVSALATYYKVKPDHILVIFDDISLPVGRIRVRRDGSGSKLAMARPPMCPVSAIIMASGFTMKARPESSWPGS